MKLEHNEDYVNMFFIRLYQNALKFDLTELIFKLREIQTSKTKSKRRPTDVRRLMIRRTHTAASAMEVTLWGELNGTGNSCNLSLSFKVKT